MENVKEGFKIIELSNLFGAPAGDNIWNIQAPVGFKETEISKEQEETLWFLLQEFTINDKKSLEWAKDMWEEGQEDEDGNCPPFDLGIWFELLKDEGNLEYLINIVAVSTLQVKELDYVETKDGRKGILLLKHTALNAAYEIEYDGQEKTETIKPESIVKVIKSF